MLHESHKTMDDFGGLLGTGQTADFKTPTGDEA
jgi:hypothetical protein